LQSLAVNRSVKWNETFTELEDTWMAAVKVNSCLASQETCKD